ncbi:MAG: hypothetical protein WCG99_04005 [Candidatus Berkelbacteria bacterium]
MIEMRKDDPRWPAHFDGAIAASGGKGSVATAIAAKHPLVLRNGGVGIRGDRTADCLITAEELPEDEEAQLFRVLDEQDTAYAGGNSEAGKGNEAAIASGRRQAAIENMHLEAVRLRGAHEIFPTQIANLLIGAGINTMGELETWSKTRLTTIPGIKDGRAQVIDEEMTEIGLPLATS